ncbi:hypothetical protein HK097_003655 [Rhizophlyctis rosea]|uniref:Rho-GAP domain-containing protein n=1 Tax=Rhizophlyctis rosea TaxID=64517 RepID=A0AAD5X6Q9_9FUNG|nr:hypothetical protein HK097_003655 [Rhizophlyctis rosea]
MNYNKLTLRHMWVISIQAKIKAFFVRKPTEEQPPYPVDRTDLYPVEKLYRTDENPNGTHAPREVCRLINAISKWGKDEERLFLPYVDGELFTRCYEAFLSGGRASKPFVSVEADGAGACCCRLVLLRLMLLGVEGGMIPVEFAKRNGDYLIAEERLIVKRFAKTIRKLPNNRRSIVLRLLSWFSKDLLPRKEQNKLSPEKLAFFFGPVFFRDNEKKEWREEIARVTTILIGNAAEIRQKVLCAFNEPCIRVMPESMYTRRVVYLPSKLDDRLQLITFCDFYQKGECMGL